MHMNASGKATGMQMCVSRLMMAAVCNTIYLKPAISLAIQLRFQYFKRVHVALDLQNMIVANKMSSSQSKRA